MTDEANGEVAEKRGKDPKPQGEEGDAPMEEAMESSVSEGGEPLPGDEEMNTLREDEHAERG